MNRSTIPLVWGRQDVDDLIRVPPEVARDFSARGCNRNLLLGNDFSAASAPGIELTFSEGNQIISNRVVHNAICGLWGGYSSETLIAGNEFADNGGMAYGLERGAINMEHASANRILDNRFRNTECAVHLWWDNDAGLLRLPGVAGNDRGVSGNVIAGNRLIIDAAQPFGELRPGERLVGLQLRDELGGAHVRDNAWFDNDVNLDPAMGGLFDLGPGCTVKTNTMGNAEASRRLGAAGLQAPGSAAWHAAVVGPVPSPGGGAREASRGPVTPSRWELPSFSILGKTHPVGARARLAGRDAIVLDEWGPWDHASPLIRARRGGFGKARFDLLGFRNGPSVQMLEGRVTVQVETDSAGRQLVLHGPPGVTPWRVRVSSGEFERTLSGTLVATRWEVTFFPWSASVDPRENLAGGRKLASGETAVHGTVTALDFSYGGGGPRDLPVARALSGTAPGADHFGMVARTQLRLPAGRWRFATLSDDGVRVRVAGRPVIENWTWHGPTRDEAVFEQAKESEVVIEVEHFEIDGYAALQFTLEPAGEEAE